MFSNKDGSAEFNQFLNFIGTRIQLQGFDGYSGDLDVSDKHLDGRFSQDHKRYIGNDNVVIVFKHPCAEHYQCDALIGISELNEVIINVAPIKKQEALMMIKNLSERPRGSGGDEPQIEGGFSDQPETDILVIYISTLQQQPSSSSSSSSEPSPSPVPIFDEDLTCRSYDNAKSDVDIDESANYSDNVDEMYYLVSVAYKSGIVTRQLPRRYLQLSRTHGLDLVIRLAYFVRQASPVSHPHNEARSLRSRPPDAL
ncbi:MAG: hypothetical protein EZS28_024908 [Streblomastix strix]|uniref:Rap-GAP domain-containing protein n=1 Tax=Streblomastix strix TaxID=222440 RepID=A0A5J4VAE7_9EUKA|nr:MAG: hypothetical protein EZS28_024908 [Streblomastix strix]